MIDRRLFVALLVPLGVLAACSQPASRADTATATTPTRTATTTHAPATTARPTATHRPGVGAAAPTVSTSGTRHHPATRTGTSTARPPTTSAPTGHPTGTRHASPTHPASTHPPKHPPTTVHPPRATHTRVAHPPVVVTAPCPPHAGILRAAKAANGGTLPPRVRIVGTLCTARYVAARLTSDAGGGVLLLTRTGGTLHVATLGSFVCTNPTVHRAPAVIRRFLHC